jgi:hypothetical protein
MAEAPLEILCLNAVKVSILQYLEPSALSVTVSRGLRFGRALWLETMQHKSRAPSEIAGLAGHPAQAADPGRVLALTAATECPSATDRAVRRLAAPIAAVAALSPAFVGSPARQY